MTDLTIPQDLWEGDKEGSLLGWLFSDGANVTEGEPVVEVMVEKAQFEIPAPASGRLVHLAAEDALVVRGDIIGRIE